MVSGTKRQNRSVGGENYMGQQGRTAYFSGGTQSRDFYTSHGGANTRFYDFKEEARANKRRPDGDDKIASKGRRKVGEARREAINRKRFVDRRRGFTLAMCLILMLLLILALIYKLVFVVNSISVSGNSVYEAEEILEASGISEGVNLYSFRASTVNGNITLYCPYISSVDIERTVPNSVGLAVTEDTPVYYVIIFGETKLLSAGLRVLETVESGNIPEGLIKLKLPTVTYSVAGRVMEFEDARYDRVIRDILATALESPLADRLTSVDLRDIYDISMVCDSRIKLVLGDSENAEIKLETAAAVMEDQMFAADNKFIVDLTIEGKTGVMIDNLMELD